jgi:hypothetical protein
LVPEGSGSSGPLARASSTLAFLLASARVRGVCPDALGESYGDTRQRRDSPSRLASKRFCYRRACGEVSIQTLHTMRGVQRAPQEHDHQTRLQVDYGPGRRRHAQGQRMSACHTCEGASLCRWWWRRWDCCRSRGESGRGPPCRLRRRSAAASCRAASSRWGRRRDAAAADAEDAKCYKYIMVQRAQSVTNI